MSGDENLWYVKTPDGDVHRVTLDQLDEAFQAGRIDENVMVLAAGESKWAKLGDLAGLDSTPPPPPAAMPFAMPSSLRPVSMDLSLDVDENAFKKKSRKGVVIAATLGIVAVFGGILFANRVHIGGSSGDTTLAAAAPAPPPPPATTAAPPPAPPPPPVTATQPAPSATDTASTLSDQQKARLAAADKALDAKIKSKKKTRVSGGGYHSAGKVKSQGFTTGGNKFDPLNANL
jgi:hypothetical protein